jgi:hypothetical protein
VTSAEPCGRLSGALRQGMAVGAARIDLRVPFSEKEEVERLGARWGADRKTWYAPAGVAVESLRKWIADRRSPNARAASYFLAESARQCWRCGRRTRVYAIMLPGNHEVLFAAEDPVDDEWQLGGEPTLLSYVEYLEESVAEQLRVMAPRYRVDYSQTTGTFYWMNHCEGCLAKLGDFETLEEWDSAFVPATRKHAEAILLREVRDGFAFAAWCLSNTDGVHLFECMRREKELR